MCNTAIPIPVLSALTNSICLSNNVALPFLILHFIQLVIWTKVYLILFILFF